MHTTSVSLLEELRQTSPGQESWTRFVNLYTPLLFYWARKLGMRDADAADLVQDVFTILVRKLPSFNYDPDKGFRDWLRTVLVNKWRNHVRDNARRVRDDASLADLADEGDVDALTEAEYHEYLLSHMLTFMRERFSTNTWKACWEHVVMDRSAAEVAADLGISVGAVYVAKSRVVSRIRQELAGLLD